MKCEFSWTIPTETGNFSFFKSHFKSFNEPNFGNEQSVYNLLFKPSIQLGIHNNDARSAGRAIAILELIKMLDYLNEKKKILEAKATKRKQSSKDKDKKINPGKYVLRLDDCTDKHDGMITIWSKNFAARQEMIRLQRKRIHHDIRNNLKVFFVIKDFVQG